MIINIRGTNGSGKTTIVKNLITAWGQEDMLDARGRTIAVRIGGTIYAVGSYSNVCGGADRVHSADGICDMVRHYAKYGHVVFESMMVSVTFQRYLNLSQEMGGMVWAFLDTPLDVCLERISGRNGGKAVNVDQITHKWTQTMRCRDKAIEAGERVVDLDHRDPMPQVYSLFSVKMGV